MVGLGILIIGLLMLLALGLAVLALLVAIVGMRRKSLALTLAGAVPFVAVGSLLVWFYLANTSVESKTPDQRAREYMVLPPDATVVKVDDNEGWGWDATIYFTVPATRSPSEWLDLIWSENMKRDEVFSRIKGDTVTHQYLRQVSLGGESRELKYDPVAGVFSYEISQEV